MHSTEHSYFGVTILVYQRKNTATIKLTTGKHVTVFDFAIYFCNSAMISGNFVEITGHEVNFLSKLRN